MEKYVSGKRINIYGQGENGPVFICGTFAGKQEIIEHLAECIAEVTGDQSYTLVVYEVNDWNRDFSIWSATECDEKFSGGGKETLQWIKDELWPVLVDSIDNFEASMKINMGYSLAGLFSMWAAYESGEFDGVICGSGSLWYPGWEEYVSMHHMQKPCRIYLSLGGKEEAQAKGVMSRIGEMTRKQQMMLRKDKNVIRETLVMNSGGHFADSGKRLAGGVKWMMEGKRC